MLTGKTRMVKAKVTGAIGAETRRRKHGYKLKKNKNNIINGESTVTLTELGGVIAATLLKNNIIKPYTPPPAQTFITSPVPPDYKINIINTLDERVNILESFSVESKTLLNKLLDLGEKQSIIMEKHICDRQIHIPIHTSCKCCAEEMK